MTIATLDIPQGWQKIRLKRIANLNPSKGEVSNLPDDTTVSFLPMEAVGESWEVDYSRTRPLAEVRNGYTYFRDGDILVAKITPCFENGKGALVNGCLNGFGFGTTEFHVIRSPNPETTRFLSYVVRSYRFKVEGAGMMTGTAGQKRLSDDYVKDFQVFLPPILERQKIARFLDLKTAAIDTLIAKKQRLIQLLEEKRTALINQAVTKGLNPNTAMKDSGIPWIGEIPEHWEALKLKRFANVSYGLTLELDRNEVNGTFIISLPNITKDGRLILEDVPKTPLSHRVKNQLLLEKGDLLFNWRNGSSDHVGKTAYFEAEGEYINVSFLLRIRMDKIQNDPRYFHMYLGHLRNTGFFSAAKTRVNNSFNQEELNSLDVMLPPNTEQAAIATHLKNETSKIDNIVSKTQTSIEKLQEYRRSLITAAVTGKLEIGEVEADV